MVSPCAISSGKGYSLYLQEDAAEEAYWLGRGAEQLGLYGAVKVEQYRLLELGKDPGTKEVLRERAGYGKSLYDVTVNAPKSVSVLGLVDERVIEAHREAAHVVAERMESMAMVRVRVGDAWGTDKVRATGNIVAGVWGHRNSREMDPQIHSHVAIVNMSWDGVEEKWKALQAVNIYRERTSLSEQYRFELANRLVRYGYEEQANEKQSMGFEVAGVSESVMRKFSQRSVGKEELIAAFREVNGREPGARVVDRWMKRYRPDKEVVPVEEARERQLVRLTGPEQGELVRLKEGALRRSEGYKIHGQRKGKKRGFGLSDEGAWEAPLEETKWEYGSRVRVG